MFVADKTYVVTGASKGFGLAISKRLLQAGAKVAMLARNNEVLQAAVESLVNDGLAADKVVGYPCDISNKAQIDDVFSSVKEHFGSFNGLINNAGLARPNPVEKLIEAEVMLQVNTNFVGTVLCCQVAIPLLRGEENPRIVNISSASAWHYDEMLHLSIYAATKAAVERFTRDLRLELQGDGIGVTCLRPGGAGTEFAAGWDTEAIVAGYEAWKRVGTHMDTGMNVEHVAEAVYQTLSYPPGVAVDLLEVRPNIPVAK